MTRDEFELEQYRSLRAEILRAMEDGNEIMSFGLAAVGIVITAGVSVKDTSLGFFIFAVIVPALSSLVLSMWFAAQERIARASYFITGIEGRLRATAGLGNIPTWDSWLRTPTKIGAKSQHHFWNTEFSGIAIFAFLMYGPLLLSLLLGGALLNRCVKGLTVVIVALALATYFYWIKRRVARWREWLTKIFGDLE